MNVLSHITLDLQHPNVTEIVYAVQNDLGTRQIKARLLDAAQEWIPPEGTFFIIRYAKPDGTKGLYSTTETDEPAVTIDGSEATITLAAQALTVPGDVIMLLNMYNGEGQKLSTFNWLVVVSAGSLTDAEVMSSDYYNILTEQITAVINARDAFTQLSVSAHELPQGTPPSAEITGGSGREDPYKIEFGIPVGKGTKGDPGPPSSVVSTYNQFQTSFSGTVIPLGEWSYNVPVVPKGQYLWTRTTINFNSGEPVYVYSVAYAGVDGDGAADMLKSDYDRESEVLMAGGIPDYVAGTLSGKQDKNLYFSGITVPASAWTDNTIYPGIAEKFPYQAAVAANGVTDTMYPMIGFMSEEAMSGNYAPEAVSGNGVVYIFCEEVPEDSITLSSLAVLK